MPERYRAEPARVK
jgi:hypothetical protein